MNNIVFLGTGGARIMMSKQLLATGGIWLQLGETQIALDPGPGALVHAIDHQLSPSHLSGIIISHRHLDHCGDANALIEAMTTGGLIKKGSVFAPADALNEDPVILRYLRNYVTSIKPLQPMHDYELGGIKFRTSMHLRHGSFQTFGFNFFLGNCTISYLPDTSYFPGLDKFFNGDILIINTVLYKPQKVRHLSVPEVKSVISNTQPRKAILTHFGMQMWRTGPHKIAENLSRETGVQVIAAYDGMTVYVE